MTINDSTTGFLARAASHIDDFVTLVNAHSNPDEQRKAVENAHNRMTAIEIKEASAPPIQDESPFVGMTAAGFLKMLDDDGSRLIDLVNTDKRGLLFLHAMALVSKEDLQAKEAALQFLGMTEDKSKLLGIATGLKHRKHSVDAEVHAELMEIAKPRKELV